MASASSFGLLPGGEEGFTGTSCCHCSVSLTRERSHVTYSCGCCYCSECGLGMLVDVVELRCAMCGIEPSFYDYRRSSAAPRGGLFRESRKRVTLGSAARFRKTADEQAYLCANEEEQQQSFALAVTFFHGSLGATTTLSGVVREGEGQDLDGNARDAVLTLMSFLHATVVVPDANARKYMFLLNENDLFVHYKESSGTTMTLDMCSALATPGWPRGGLPL